MADPVITFNSSTGSDTAASGSGGTAIGGSGAATTASNANVDLSADAPDLSGVATDGSACMWVDSSSGRQFSKILSLDNGTKIVTCADTFANSESSRNWGIGGKRATLENADSRTLFGSTGAKAAWIIQLDDDQSITTALTIAAPGSATVGRIVLRSSTVYSLVTITQTGNAQALTLSGSATYWYFQDLKIDNSNATKTNAYGIGLTISNAMIGCNRCVFGSATNKLNYGIFSTAGSAQQVQVIDCRFENCITSGIVNNTGSANTTIISSVFRDGGISGPQVLPGTGNLHIFNSQFTHGKNDAIRTTNSMLLCFIMGCTIHGNKGNGINLSANTTQGLTFVVANNQITANSGYGILGNTLLDNQNIMFDWNNFGAGVTANTSGGMFRIASGIHDLIVDPQYTNSAAYDFTIGTNTKAMGFPDATKNIGVNPTSGNISYVDIGAVQREESAVAVASLPYIASLYNKGFN